MATRAWLADILHDQAFDGQRKLDLIDHAVLQGLRSR
jgi:hypothetical protein